MKIDISFSIFLRDNKSKLTTRYPFLSQDQILSRLRQQWRKLNDPSNKDLNSLNRSQRQQKLSYHKTTKLRVSRRYLNENERKNSGIHDFVGGGYDKNSNFYKDKNKKYSPYLFSNDSLSKLSKWSKPVVTISNLEDRKDKNGKNKPNISRSKSMTKYNQSDVFHSSLEQSIEDKSLDLYLPSSVGTMKLRKWERKKVLQASENGEHKVQGIFEFHDDEERSHFEIKTQETAVCQSMVMKRDHTFSHQLLPFPKSSGIQTEQDNRKQYFSHADEKIRQISSKKFPSKLPVLQKDGTPARFSKRLLSKKDPVDVRSIKLAESRFKMSNNNNEKEVKYDYFFPHKHRKINEAKNILSHQTIAKREESAVVPKLRVLTSSANIAKVKQGQQEVNADILNKFAKTKGLFHEDEVKKKLKRICPQPWSNSCYKTMTRGKDQLQANVTLGTDTETACMLKMNINETTASDDIPRSPLNYDEDLAIDTMEHCICSDDEDCGLLLKRYSLAHDENTLEGNYFTKNNTSPIQHKSVSKQNVDCTQSKFIMDSETTQIKERNIFSEQRKISSCTKNCYAVPKEYKNPDELQYFKEKGIIPKLEKKLAVDVKPEKQCLANDSKMLSEIKLPLQTTCIRQTARNFLCIDKDLDKFDKDMSETDGLDTSSDVSQESNGDEKCDSFFCSQVTSETNAVLLQALMKIKATGSSPENMLSTNDIQESPVMLSPESQSRKMHLLPGDLVTKRATIIKMKKEHCDWSLLNDSKTLSSKDSDGDNSLFKEPLGVMFQDPTIDALADVKTPGKRRLVTSAVAATPSNFESMFDAFDIFL